MLKKTFLGLAIGWTVLIAFLCLITFSDLPSLHVSGADKYVHSIFHFVFTILWGIYVSLKQNELKLPPIVRLVFISVCYGILIEVLQHQFTKTRHADILDVLANTIGALVALLLFVFIKRRKANNH